LEEPLAEDGSGSGSGGLKRGSSTSSLNSLLGTCLLIT
jgi:hypothetical protein